MLCLRPACGNKPWPLSNISTTGPRGLAPQDSRVFKARAFIKRDMNDYEYRFLVHVFYMSSHASYRYHEKTKPYHVLQIPDTILSFFKAKPSRGNGLVNTVSDYLGPGVFVAQHSLFLTEFWRFCTRFDQQRRQAIVRGMIFVSATFKEKLDNVVQRFNSAARHNGHNGVDPSCSATASWPQLQPANDVQMASLHCIKQRCCPILCSGLINLGSSFKQHLNDVQMAPGRRRVHRCCPIIILVGSSLFAPALSSNATASLLLYSAAQNKGVTVMFPRLSTSAPASVRTPLHSAEVSGNLPP